MSSKTLNSVKRDARAVARANGHLPSRFRRYFTIDGGETYVAVCLNCGEALTLTSQPDASGNRVRGKLNQRCPYARFQRATGNNGPARENNPFKL